MGAACCCSREEFVDPSSPMRRDCINLCFVQNFVHMYTSLFHREEGHSLFSSSQSTASSYPMVPLDNSFPDMYRSPPRPLPYDADPRCFRLQQFDRLVSRREKGSSYPHDDSEPLRTNGADEQSELLSNKNKWNEFVSEEGSKDSRLPSKLPNSKTGFIDYYTSSEEEDVCPTCLEEYTTENPKIITECSHHYHLGCIYEWMERSDKCPICGKVMAFNETI